MDFSKHFIEHPRLATVISIFIFLTGLLAIFQLPISEYPEWRRRRWWYARNSRARIRA